MASAAACSWSRVGAAIVTPLTLTLLSEAFPPAKRGLAIGAWSGISGLGVALGPVVGGAVVDGISWHWIFWLNVPIGIAVLPLAARRLTESYGPAKELDLPGLALGGLGLLGIVYGIVRGTELGWTSPTILASIAGILSDRIGSRPLMATGLALQSIAIGWLASVSSPTTPYGELVIPFILAGTGMALVFAPTANAVLNAVRPKEAGQASGATNAIREVGGVLGIAVLASVFSANGSYASPQAR